MLILWTEDTMPNRYFCFKRSALKQHAGLKRKAVIQQPAFIWICFIPAALLCLNTHKAHRRTPASTQQLALSTKNMWIMRLLYANKTLFGLVHENNIWMSRTGLDLF